MTAENRAKDDYYELERRLEAWRKTSDDDRSQVNRWLEFVEQVAVSCYAALTILESDYSHEDEGSSAIEQAKREVFEDPMAILEAC